MYAIYVTKKDMRHFYCTKRTLDESEEVANNLKGIVEVFESGKPIITLGGF